MLFALYAKIGLALFQIRIIIKIIPKKNYGDAEWFYRKYEICGLPQELYKGAYFPTLFSQDESMQKRRIAFAMRLFGFNFSGYTSLRRVAMSSAALAMKSETVMSTVLSSLPRTETVPFATSLSPTISI